MSGIPNSPAPPNMQSCTAHLFCSRLSSADSPVRSVAWVASSEESLILRVRRGVPSSALGHPSKCCEGHEGSERQPERSTTSGSKNVNTTSEKAGSNISQKKLGYEFQNQKMGIVSKFDSKIKHLIRIANKVPRTRWRPSRSRA